MNTLKLGLIVPLFALAAASLSTGCASTPPGDAQSPAPGSTEPACSLIGCEDSLLIRLDAQRWEAGNYTFQFDVDGEASECSGSVPWVCGQECATTGIAFYGCTQEADSSTFEGIRISGSPKRVSLTIQRDGATVASKVFEPEYRHVQPNGPQCEPICHQATENLSVVVLR